MVFFPALDLTEQIDIEFSQVASPPDDRCFVFSIALKNIVLDGIAFKGSHHTNYNLFPFRPIVSAVAIFTDLTVVRVKKR